MCSALAWTTSSHRGYFALCSSATLTLSRFAALEAIANYLSQHPCAMDTSDKRWRGQFFDPKSRTESDPKSAGCQRQVDQSRILFNSPQLDVVYKQFGECFMLPTLQNFALRAQSRPRRIQLNHNLLNKHPPTKVIVAARDLPPSRHLECVETRSISSAANHTPVMLDNFPAGVVFDKLLRV